MNFAEFSAGEFWISLLRAEISLTVHILCGLIAGELILSSGVVERIFAPLAARIGRRGIGPLPAGALVVALGSSRAASAMLSAGYANGELTREEATFGTLSLAFPAYIRRWVGTAAVASGIAGRAGLVFAVILIMRSFTRFVWMLIMLRRAGGGRRAGNAASAGAVLPGARIRRRRIARLMLHSLPWAWTFFAVTYALMPRIEYLFTHKVAFSGAFGFLSPAGWAVAASSLAHVTAALSSAAGALAAGDLDAGGAVLALLVGHMAGTVTRVMRQNVGYWLGVFPREMMPGLVRWHLATLLSLEALSIFMVWSVV